jgi:hypothetical protein
MALIPIALLSGPSETAWLDVKSIPWAHVGSLVAFVPALGLPRIGFEHDRTIGLFDPDPPTSRGVTRRKRVAAYLVYVVTARLGGPNRRLELVGGVDVGDGFLAVATDSEHGRPASWMNAEAGGT